MSQFYTYTVNQIDRIDFTLSTNKETRDRSVTKLDPNGIDSADPYDGMRPKRGGLIDARLGVINNHSKCDTCNLPALECPGHFGHIELAEPVFHVGLIKYLQKIFNCICLRCARLRANKTEKELVDMLKKNKLPKQRFAEIRNLTKTVTYCYRAGNGCGTPSPKIKITPRRPGIVEIIAQTDIKHLASDKEA